MQCDFCGEDVGNSQCSCIQSILWSGLVETELNLEEAINTCSLSDREADHLLMAFENFRDIAEDLVR